MMPGARNKADRMDAHEMVMISISIQAVLQNGNPMMPADELGQGPGPEGGSGSAAESDLFLPSTPFFAPTATAADMRLSFGGGGGGHTCRHHPATTTTTATLPIYEE